MKTPLTVAALAIAGLAITAPLAAQGDMGCPHRRVAVEGRRSPLDSATIQLGSQRIKVCYGRPSARGRTMIGGDNVPFGQLWRTGANEPTVIYTTAATTIAGIGVPAGIHALYTVPGETEWIIIVNRAVDQWGHEGSYTEEIIAQEIARAQVPSTANSEYVETFTIELEPTETGADIVLMWERTRVAIPVVQR
ncbi:MAG: DUF2911 domain-containing protein [Gemmatimonadetes bacterium]|nr:DUF2911 domain-containing protein [Gemmatimonadota bacterium]